MFTGLIEALGTIADTRIDQDGVGRWMTIRAPFAGKLSLGESVSVNGTCLTVVEVRPDAFSVQVSPTTLNITTLGHLNAAQRVNLERSVTPETRLGGHWVLGHVDTRGTVLAVVPEGDAHHITVQFPDEFQRWVLPQGSITLDGISLTIVDRAPNQVSVTIIPHTWSHTIIHDWAQGTLVNVEFDVLGKYLEHLLDPYAKGGVPHVQS